MTEIKLFLAICFCGMITMQTSAQVITTNDSTKVRYVERRALVLTLESYKQKVLDYNQNIKIATQTFDAATAAAKAIKTGYFPKLDATGTYQYNLDPQNIALGSLNAPLEAQNWQTGGGISQNIYTGGQLAGAYNAAKIERDIASLAEDLSVDNISYSAEIAYWNATASQAYMDASKKYLSIVQDLQQVVQTHTSDNYVNKTDLIKVQTKLKEAEFQVSRAEQEYTNNCIILNVLMGKDVYTFLYLKDSIQDTPSIPNPIPLEKVLQRRPDYLIKNKEINLQIEKGNIERSEFLPKLTIGGTAGYGTKIWNTDGSLAFSPIVYAQLNIPLLQWGKSQHIRNKNKALTVSKELSLSQTQDEIKKDVTTALNNVNESLRQIIIAKENLEITIQSMDLHTSGYQAGRISMLDVQSAQLSWLQAQTNVIGSLLNNKLALAGYKKAISE